LGPPFTTLPSLGAAALATAIQKKLDEYFDPMEDAVKHAHDAMHIVVAASGNGNYDPNDPLNTADTSGDNIDRVPFYPASFGFDNIIGVTATQIADDHRTVYANFGKQHVDLGAPAYARTTTPFHSDTSGYIAAEGTSIAAPYVAGVVALVWDMHPDWSYSQVISQVFEGVDKVAALEPETVTGGRLNALGAVAPGSWILHTEVLGAPAGHGGLSSAHGARITFNQSIRPETFTTADVKLWDTTTGTDVSLPVSNVAAISDRTFEVIFPNINGAEHNGDDGNYRLEIGPHVSNLDERRIDLDRNGISGETIQDRLTMEFRVKLELQGIDDVVPAKPDLLEP
jgi:subtilisin family serine protease